jgi:TM2 domain-containing membrane protein YozV
MIDEGMSSLKTNTAERQAAIRTLLSKTDVSTKEADTAFLIELVGGVFGLFGLGHLYAGLTNTGIFRLVLGFVGLSIIYFVLGVTVIGLCAAPLVWIAQIAIAYFTATDLKQSINAVKAGGGGMSSPMSTPSAYIESPSPINTSSNDSLFNSPPPTSTSGSGSLFTNPTPPPASTPLSDDDDFNPDDLTTKA